MREAVPANAPEFIRRVTAGNHRPGRGDALPVSALPADGTYPVGTTQWEKRNIAEEHLWWEKDSVSNAVSALVSALTAVIRSKFL